MAREIGENKMAVSQRQIKFRVWDSELKRFRNDCYIGSNGVLWFNDAGRLGSLEQDAFIVQCETGLKDKHGIEIFEGDVLKKMGVDYDVELDYDADPDAEYPIIEIGRGVATMERFPVFWLNNEAFGYEGEDLENPDEWEIIGNIFEHPHLLDGGDRG